MGEVVAPVSAALNVQAPMEVNEDFATYPDGALTTLVSGQEWELLAYQGEADSLPRVESGRMTFDDDGRGGGYAAVHLGGPITRVGATWAFTSFTNGGGSMTFALMDKMIGSSPGLGRMGLHLRIEPTLWALGVVDGPSPTSVTDLHIGSFSTPLAADGVTEHRVEVTVDREQQRVFLTLPDGSVIRSRAHAAFAQLCDWVFWEPYRDVGGTPSTKTKPLFHRVWASSREPNAAIADRAIDLARRPITVKTIPGPDHAFTNALTELGGSSNSRVITAIPSSGQMLVTVTGWIENDADFTGRNRILLCNDSMAELASADLPAAPGYSGTFSVQIPYSVDVTTPTNAPGKPLALRFGVIAPSVSSKSRIKIATTGLVSRCIAQVLGY